MTDLAQLIVQHIPRLRRYARALTGDADQADDLVQECLARAWSRIHRWQGGDDIRPWLFTIMHNLFANTARRRARAPVFVSLAGEDPPGAADLWHGAALDLRDLKAALAALPADQREIILLVALEGLSYAEVASVLDIPLGTVMSRLARARERLRGSLQGRSTPKEGGR